MARKLLSHRKGGAGELLYVSVDAFKSIGLNGPNALISLTKSTIIDGRYLSTLNVLKYTLNVLKYST